MYLWIFDDIVYVLMYYAPIAISAVSASFVARWGAARFHLEHFTHFNKIAKQSFIIVRIIKRSKATKIWHFHFYQINILHFTTFIWICPRRAVDWPHDSQRDISLPASIHTRVHVSHYWLTACHSTWHQLLPASIHTRVHVSYTI